MASLRRVSPDAVVDGDVVVRGGGSILVGERLFISGAPVRSHLVTGPNGVLRIGAGVRIAHGAAITAYAEVEIGDDTSLAPFVTILDVDFHEIKDRSSIGEPRPVRIGRGVRLGSGVIVLRGAVIGDGACIAPNSVVSRIVPAGAFASGVPARPVPGH